jgi:hypothetical protein
MEKLMKVVRENKDVLTIDQLKDKIMLGEGIFIMHVKTSVKHKVLIYNGLLSYVGQSLHFIQAIDTWDHTAYYHCNSKEDFANKIANKFNEDSHWEFEWFSNPKELGIWLAENYEVIGGR